MIWLTKFKLFVSTNSLYISDKTRFDSSISNYEDPFIALAKKLNSICKVFSPKLLTYKKNSKRRFRNSSQISTLWNTKIKFWFLFQFWEWFFSTLLFALFAISECENMINKLGIRICFKIDNPWGLGWVVTIRIVSLTSLDMGWTNVHPDFHNSYKKLISHLFRVIKV